MKHDKIIMSDIATGLPTECRIFENTNLRIIVHKLIQNDRALRMALYLIGLFMVLPDLVFD